MRILALDPAIHLGWAFDSAAAGVPLGGTHLLPEPEGTKREGRERGRTFAALRHWLLDRIEQMQPAMIVKEAPLNIVMMNYRGRKIGTNPDAIALQYGMAAIIEEVCHERHVELRDATADDIKRYAGGKRGSGKQPTMNFCTFMRWDFADDNTADAKVLWSLAKSTYARGFQPRMGAA